VKVLLTPAAAVPVPLIPAAPRIPAAAVPVTADIKTVKRKNITN
jgi:hypothetical protein